MNSFKAIDELEEKIISCKRCPRLVRYREACLRDSPKYRDQEFWRKPVPGFGDINGQILIVGLAPAATGGNRTGRVFTGDKSSDFLVSALFDLKLANQPVSTSRSDGLVYYYTFITAAVKCVPPDNKPTAKEIDNCSKYLSNEIRLMKNLRSIVCLGRTAFDAVEKFYRAQDPVLKRNMFRNGSYYSHGDVRVYCLYHPSPRNVNTRRITREGFIQVLIRAKQYAREGSVIH